MAQGNLRAYRVPHAEAVARSFAARGSRADAPMSPSTPAPTLSLAADFASGQRLAGTGALVFEGEVLELPARSRTH